MKLIISFIFSCFILLFSYSDASAACRSQNDRASDGSRCGGRASEVRQGGLHGGDGYYQDSYNRTRKYGRGNDPYDRY